MAGNNEIVDVEPDHPLWSSFDDDDWGGATCSQYINHLHGCVVRLDPPLNCSQDLLDRVRKSIERVAQSVEIK